MLKRTVLAALTFALGACATGSVTGPGRLANPAQPVVVPKPVAAPQPEPEIAAPPRPEPKRAPVIQRVAIETELLFDFDSAALRPEGRDRLDEIALKLHRARIESIEAIGHADRIASDGYNQELSEDRAAAVKDYLARLGFDPRDIRAEGHGEREPITGARCDGLGPEDRHNLKLVGCLQPNRRVELEVRGVNGGT